MNNDTLYKTYFQEGTPGNAIIRKFHSRYADLLSRVHLVDLDDIVHEVFVSLAKTDFSEVRNIEHYVMRAIKLHCWALVDRAIRAKRLASVTMTTDPGNEVEDERKQPTSQENPEQAIEGLDLLNHINQFKGQIRQVELRILNMMIDDEARTDIAGTLGLNLNTVDTHIHRIRQRLGAYLHTIGYSHPRIRKFSDIPRTYREQK